MAKSGYRALRTVPRKDGSRDVYRVLRGQGTYKHVLLGNVANGEKLSDHHELLAHPTYQYYQPKLSEEM